MSTLTTSGCPDVPLAKSAIAGASFPGTHAMKVTLAAGVVTVLFDGQTKIVHTLAGYAPSSAYFGFTAANGSVAAPVTVSGITIGFPTQPNCP